MPAPVQMTARFHCPGCGVALRVPAIAAGLAARCPSCRTIFRVPRQNELVEETIATWIEQDVDQLITEHQEQILEAQKALESVPVRTPGERKESLRHKRWKPKLKPAPPEPASAPRPPEVAPEVNASEPALVPEPEPDPEPSAVSVAAPAELPRISDAAFPPPATDGAAPRLHIVHCSADGVLFSFDAQWLNQLGFRASMPVRCAFSGVTDRNKLLARPLVFIDQSGAVYRSPRELESRYEQHLSVGQTTRELAHNMPQLPGFLPPFNLPMPYYATPQCAKLSLQCHTRTRDDGGLVCFVHVPDGHYALQWLANVNGICGADYERLEQEVLNLQGEAWRSLSQEVRARLAVWCAFRPRERFELYINDCDFGRSDAGLAGLVVTSERIIFHKFHHTGEASRRAPGTITVKPEVRGQALTLNTDDRHMRMIVASAEDVKRLTEVLAAAGELRVT